MKIHELKTHPQYFRKTLIGCKPFEIRLNDRDFKIGDTVILKEWDEDCGEYTGRELSGRIRYILHDNFVGISKGYIAFTLELFEDEYHRLAEDERSIF